MRMLGTCRFQTRLRMAQTVAPKYTAAALIESKRGSGVETDTTIGETFLLFDFKWNTALPVALIGKVATYW